MNTHTKGPWFQGQIKGTAHQIFTSDAGVFIDDEEANHADIAFIVRACNAHDELVKAINEALVYLPSEACSNAGEKRIRTCLENALALARGKEQP